VTDTGTTLANQYLKVDTSTSPGTGIVGQTMQFHGPAEQYTLSGATAVATLYSNATTATTSPAVTLRSVGTSGGQAAAFTYDQAPESAIGGTASNVDRFMQLSPAGCVVAAWQCIRATSWIFPNNPVTNEQAAQYVAQGFEIALHPVVASCPTTVITDAQLSAI